MGGIIFLASSIKCFTDNDVQGGLFLLALCVILILYTFRGKPDKLKSFKCRKCGIEGKMAIEYENDGICRKCLDECLEAQGLISKDKER